MRLFPTALFCAATVLLFSAVPFVYSQMGTGAGNVLIDARVPGCGDAIIDGGEDCDTSNMAERTCITQGFSSGSLVCTASCTFNTSACVLAPVGNSSGGGGNSNRPEKSQVVLSGRAYPKSTITILKDAQVVATTIADANARFQVNVSSLSSGSYIFSLYSEDSQGFRSSLLTFPVAGTKGILAKIENIFVAPTIAVNKSVVKKGDPLTLFGQSVPAAEVTLEINSAEQIFVKTKADSAGAYLHIFDTSILELGPHHAKSRSAFAFTISSQSNAAPFTVGNENILVPIKVSCPVKADLNTDCRVNLVDFSIAAFWYNRTLGESFLQREQNKLSGDKKVNITDFSIMAFYWTG